MVRRANRTRRTRADRRPVTGEHPCIAAAVAVLKANGGPMKVGEIHAAAAEAGLLPESSKNTIRARFTAHVRSQRHPLITPLPRRGGWALSGDTSADHAPRSGRTVTERTVKASWLTTKRAPAELVALVKAAPGEALTVRALLLRALDVAALAWLLHSLPFRPDLRERLLRAKGVQGRTSTLNAEDRARAESARPTRRRRTA